MRLLLCLALPIALFSLSSCGAAPASTAITCVATTATTSQSVSNNSCTDPVTGITITISPAPASVDIVTALQFSAAVQGSTDTVVTWQVNNVTGGNSTTGTIDSNGLYHAPSVIPSPSTVNVTAVSYDEPTLTASSTVTIMPAPTTTISPTSISITAGVANTATFTSTVTGATNTSGAPDTNVNWYVGNAVGNVLGGTPTYGTINANGVYSAPATPPIGSTAIVTVASAAFPLATASATVTVSGYSTSSLKGQFAFSMAGKILSGASAGPFFRAGTFTADGAGNLSGGLEDINETSGVTSGYSFAGSYTVSADGRGTLKFNDTHAPANLASSNFDFVLVNGNQLQITGFDASGSATYTGTAGGQANLQAVTTFTNNSLSALNGTYVFDFTGVHGSNAVSQIGEFAADGAGHITGGSIDINNGGTPGQFQIAASTYSIASSGRGTLTLATTDPTFPTLTFSFYIVSTGSAKFVGTDSAQALSGATMQQSPNATFSLSSLSGNYAFLLAGSSSGGILATATAGNFLADGNGNFTSGVLDENIGGAPNPGVPFSGTYVVPAAGSVVTSTGRGTATFTGGRTYVFYLGPTGTAVFQETDAIHPNIAADGVFTQQQSAAFSFTSIQGNYSIGTNGLSGSSPQEITGQLGANGAGLVTSGAIDINTAGTLTKGEAVSGAYVAPASSGRSTLQLNPSGDNRNFAIFVVNTAVNGQLQEIFVVGMDSGRLASGIMFRQF